MADPRIYLNTQPIQPLGNHKGKLQCSGQSRETASFSDLLREAGRQIVFSRHAQERLQQRGLPVSEDMIHRLEDTVDRLAQKGARKSLVCLDDVALVVSVTNRTVITAMDGMRGNENIITNIDSAAIL